MPLIIPLDVAFVAFIAAFGVFLLMRTEAMWLRPLVQALQHPHGSWLKRQAFKALGAVAAATLFIEKQVRLSLSHFAAGSLHLLTRFFAGLAASTHYAVKELGDITPRWADHFAWFRHHTLPREIHARTVPIKAVATHADRTAGIALGRVRAEERSRRRSISGLNKKTGLLAGILLGIDILVKRAHAPAHHRDHTRTLPRHGREITDTKARLKRIERALGLGVIAAAVFKVLARVAPWLFCRNVKKLGQVACGLNPATMNSLIGLLLGVYAIGNLEQMTRFALSVEEELAKDLKDLLGA